VAAAKLENAVMCKFGPHAYYQAILLQAVPGRSLMVQSAIESVVRLAFP